MRLIGVAALLALAGCSMILPTQVERRPTEGYQALRFRETVRLEGAVGNTWEFPAGTMLIADRRRTVDGELLYCGPMIIKDIGAETRPMCVSPRNGRLFINTEVLQEGFGRDLPPGSIEEVRAP